MAEEIWEPQIAYPLPLKPADWHLPILKPAIFTFTGPYGPGAVEMTVSAEQMRRVVEAAKRGEIEMDKDELARVENLLREAGA